MKILNWFDNILAYYYKIYKLIIITEELLYSNKL